jgi:hypothetical protein
MFAHLHTGINQQSQSRDRLGCSLGLGLKKLSSTSRSRIGPETHISRSQILQDAETVIFKWRS